MPQVTGVLVKVLDVTVAPVDLYLQYLVTSGHRSVDKNGLPEHIVSIESVWSFKKLCILSTLNVYNLSPSIDICNSISH